MLNVRSNYHTHTTYCDGASSPREIAEQAVSLSMTELGFSGHSYTSIDESYCMSREGMRSYYNEVGALAEEYGSGACGGGAASDVSGSCGNGSSSGAAGRLRILRGIEMDYFSDPCDYEFDWDYIICSCHYIKKGGSIFPVDESEEILLDACSRFYSGDIYSFIEDYYTEVGNVLDVVRAGCITAESSGDAKLIIGHFDLITKFNEGGKLFDESDPRYVSAWKGALDRIVRSCGCSGIGIAASEAAPAGFACDGAAASAAACVSSGSPEVLIEINTGAMSRGYRTSPYPAGEILTEAARHGVPVILSSDSHEKSTLLYGFDEAARLAEECGARVVTSLSD